MRLENCWYRVTPVHLLLYPPSLVYRFAVALRRMAYRVGLLRARPLPVPVIVIGNVTVGGTGKTPLALWLVALLRQHGYRPGIVSRGYGGSNVAPRAVREHSDPAAVGDEPLLLARRSGVAVWVGRDRAATAGALLAAQPDCNVIVSDDGLQHYALARDIELAVVDGERGLGNALLLPAGPLREPAARLATVTAVVVNGDTAALPALPCGEVPVFAMRLTGATFYNLLNPRHQATVEQLQGRRLHAVAGIGNPQRFFGHLRRLGLSFAAHPFPDHHRFRPADLDFAGADSVLMTEKDAVKCESFATDRHWVLAAEAEVTAAAGALILDKLRT